MVHPEELKIFTTIEHKGNITAGRILGFDSTQCTDFYLNIPGWAYGKTIAIDILEAVVHTYGENMNINTHDYMKSEVKLQYDDKIMSTDTLFAVSEISDICSTDDYTAGSEALGRIEKAIHVIEDLCVKPLYFNTGRRKSKGEQPYLYRIIIAPYGDK
jgi:hypothetical protein